MQGWVYVATMNNVSSIVKICCSDEDPVSIINEWAEHAGIPGSANLEYAALVDCPRRVEKKVYEDLKGFNTKNDWFQVTALQAMAAIKSEKRARVFEEKGSLIETT